MKSIESLDKWAYAHTYFSIDILRVALGLFLFIKGLHFISQSQILIELIEPLKGFGGMMVSVHYVAFAHLVGGFLIAFGLLSRLAIAVQIPILLGAVLINFVGEMNPGNLFQAFVVLLISMFFIFYGSGKHSADFMIDQGY